MEPTERKLRRKRDHDSEVCRVIDALGGTGAVAVLCDVSDAAVSQWKSNGIPKPQLRILKLTRPDIFEDLNQTQSAAA